jgi:hypothetical protein
MKSLFFILSTLVLTFGVFITSCGSSEDYEKRTLNYSEIIEVGIDYLFKTRQFSPTFYTSPVKIVDSKKFPLEIKFMFNGRQVEKVPPRSTVGYLSHTGGPLPYVKVNDISVGRDEKIHLELEFPSIRTTYQLELTQVTEARKEVVWSLTSIDLESL